MHLCIATVTLHYRDECNRWTSERSTRVVKAETEDGLYEAMARLRAECAPTPDPDEDDDDRWEDERRDPSFGPVMRVAESHPSETSRLDATAAWRAHLAAVERARAAREARRAAVAKDEDEAEEASARALYETLRAHFGEAPARDDDNEEQGSDR